MQLRDKQGQYTYISKSWLITTPDLTIERIFVLFLFVFIYPFTFLKKEVFKKKQSSLFFV